MIDNLLESSTNGTYNYMDGTYLKGSQNSNYAWFDGFLWRIMGKNADGSIRMITQDTLSSVYWGSSGEMLDYDNSYINDWLNNYFYPKLEHKDLLVNQIWCSEPTTDSNSARTSCTNNLSKISKPIGLLSLDEFNLSGSYSSISSMETPNMDALSYLINNNQFATLTTSDNDEIWGLFRAGLLVDSVHYLSYYNGFVGIRPIINLKSDTKIYAGDGSFNNPFQFEENNEKTGTLIDNGNIGKYVMYAGRKYRIVETSSAGTKLFLTGYYDYSGDGLIDDSDSISELDLFNIISQDSIVNWISNNNETDKNKLISTTWYKGDDIIPGDNYKTILESTSNPYSGKIGLIRVGEIMAAQPGVSYDMIETVSDDIAELISQKSYWTSNRDSNSNQMQVYCDSGYTNGSSDCGPHVIRPVIMIGPDVQILGGNGTFNNPYQI